MNSYPQQPLEELNASVLEVIFRSDSTGYTVLVVRESIEKETITAVGSMPDVSVGDILHAKGFYTIHSTYGEQFQVRSYTVSEPEGQEAMVRYLASGAIKGVGEALARRIVDKFGDNTFHILETEPERLEEIKGISAAGACSIGAQYAENSRLRSVIMFFQQNGLSSALAMRVYREMGEDCVARIRENPYILMDEVSGIGFKRADDLAFRMGIEGNDPRRMEACVRQWLNLQELDGNTYGLRSELEEAFLNEIGEAGTLLENAISLLREKFRIVQAQEEGETRLYERNLYRAEELAAGKLCALAHNAKPIDAGPAELAQVEKNEHLTLSDDQKEAVLAALREGVSVITGGPGTGKTTIIKALIGILELGGIKYELAAPTGRAAKRIQETTKSEARTLHRLLEYKNNDNGRGGTFSRYKDNPVDTEVVIVDEMSMVDARLFYHLLDALPLGTRLVMVGDKDQLPSVGAGNVLSDVIGSGLFQVSELTRIYRQEAQSDIVFNAQRIRSGDYPICNQNGTDFFMIPTPGGAETKQKLVELLTTRLPKYLKTTALRDIQVLCPQRQGPCGVESLNPLLQQVLNPPSPKKKEFAFRELMFREGDRVMQTRNNYELVWSITNQYGYSIEEGDGVFNGDIGFVKDVDEHNHTITVVFDGNKEVEYNAIDMEDLDLAYAVTIHKAQGSEMRAVVLVLMGVSPRMYSRNLIYTAVTRAKELVLVLGSEEIMRSMVDNHHPELRRSSLKLRLSEFI